MRTVIQRVSQASVTVDDQVTGSIQQGLMILCGFEPTDTEQTLETMLNKCLRYRIFSDAQGKMNLSLQDVQGGLLLVPQFTLMADTQKGLRPSFSRGASPELGEKLFDQLLALASSKHQEVEAGVFGADMQVHLCNDGPVTLIMDF